MLQLMPIDRLFSIEGFFSAFQFDWDESFVFNGESHPFWEAVYVLSGEVEVTEDENVYILGEGNLIFHAPMEFHRIKSAQGSSPSGYIISFGTSGCLPEHLSEGVFHLEPSARQEYEEICERARHFMSSPEDRLGGQQLASLLDVFLIRLNEKTATGRRSMTQSAAEYRRIVSFMSERVCENLTLTDIAKANNVSISYVKLLFSTYAGISPKSYFNQLRARRASELLCNGLSVTEVSDVMNFSSPNYFSAFYKKHTGLSPSDMQKGI